MSVVFKFKYGQLVIHDGDSYEYSVDFPLESIILLAPILEVKESLKKEIDIIFDTDEYNFSKGIILKLSTFVEDPPEVSHLFTRIKIKNKNDIEKALNIFYFKNLRKIFPSSDAHYIRRDLSYVAIHDPYLWAHDVILEY